MNLRSVLLVATALAATACDKSRKESASGDVDLAAYEATLGTRKGPIGMTDHQVLRWLSDSHRNEVELGDFAMSASVDPETRSLAAEMRTEHGRLVREGGMLAKQLTAPNAEDSLSAPQIDSLDAWHARAMEALRKLRGEALERALAREIVGVHTQMLDSMRKWDGKALDPKLNTAMEKAIPIEERHLTAAKAIEERLRKAAKAHADSLKKAAKAGTDSSRRR